MAQAAVYRRAALRWSGRALRTTSAACIALLLVAALGREFLMLGWIERQLLYFPSRDVAQPLTAFGPGAEEVWFGEHARLHGVFVPGQVPGEQRITLLFFHGNGGNLTHRAPFVARLRTELGVNVFIFDYQGYGRSEGVPSEAALHADARAAVSYLESRADLDPSRVVYYGESLGGAVAIQLATVRPPAGLIVQSSFTSIGDMASLHYPLLAPLLPYVATRYDSLGAVATIQAPLLLIHGDADPLVPAEQSRQLQAAARGPTRLVVVPGAGHNDVIARGGADVWAALRTFLAEIRPGT